MSDSIDCDGWLGVDEIAESLSLARRSVYNWLKAGKLRYRRTVGGPIRIDPASVWADDTGPRTPWIVDQKKSDGARRSWAKGRANNARSRRFA